MAATTEALRIFSEAPDRFDLVITDQTMPGILGTTLAQNMLSVRPNLPVILCAGHGDAVSPDTSKALCIRECVMKPLTRQELAKAVQRALR